jgi:indolepyruvate ferredoxin oxidoreductase alpha subunit
MTTRVCHSKSVVVPRDAGERTVPPTPHFEHDIAGRVMIPAHARPAHRRLRAKLAEIAAWSEDCALNRVEPGRPGRPSQPGEGALGIIVSGVSYLHAAEAAPGARILKIGLVNPLPIEKARAFVADVDRAVVIEEGDPIIADSLRAAGIAVESKAETYRFGELDVPRLRRILAGDVTSEPPPARGKPPELCPACPYHTVYATLKQLDCIVAGDIGCYTLGVLPPYRAMDTCVAMGASIGVGLGLRHVLPDEQARRVVSIIGDSTFVHSGISGLVEMAYNPPSTGHVVIVLDNGTTAMTGQQEHPGTGRSLDHAPTNKLSIEGIATAIGIASVSVIDAYAEPERFEQLLIERLAAPELSVIVARRPCILAAADIRRWERQADEIRAMRAQACSAVEEP